MYKKTLILLLLLFILSGCATQSDRINVISREDGSGTRNAFTELFDLKEEELDQTRKDAEITNSTAIVLQTVSGDKNAVGYISIGSLNDSVKPLQIDNVVPSVENIKNGNYSIYRPFLVVTKDENPLVTDFISFINSRDGQRIVEAENCVPSVENASEYKASGLTGKITIAGSSSVTPVMESLIEAYQKQNEGVEIELQQSDSTTGITSVTEGVTDIGMSSRELTDAELSADLSTNTIAYDGLAVITNTENPVTSLTTEQVKQIYTGDLEYWSEVDNE